MCVFVWISISLAHIHTHTGLKFKYTSQVWLAVTHRSLNGKFSLSLFLTVVLSWCVIFLSLSTSMVIKWQQSEKLDKVLSVHTDVGGLLQKQERLLYSNTTYSVVWKVNMKTQQSACPSANTHTHTHSRNQWVAGLKHVRVALWSVCHPVSVSWYWLSSSSVNERERVCGLVVSEFWEHMPW